MAIVAIGLLPACAARESSQPAPKTPEARSGTASRGLPAVEVTDADIRAAVSRNLARDNSLPAPLIGVTVDNGVVSLVGRVNRGSERLRAAELAELTRGVRAVVNRLTVEPGWAPRSDLALEVRASLLQVSAEEFANVTVTAEGSRVRLTGSVPHARGKEMAERGAWFVSGVTAVDNQLRVRPSAERPDQEIAQDITRNLRADPYVGSAPLAVSVNEGRVRLSGAVQSLFERRRARERALVAGVFEVNDDAVRVLPETVRLPSRAEAPSTDRDAALAVRDALRADPRVPEQSVDSQVSNGVVTLTGRVRTLSQKLAAAEDARNAVGTWVVINRIEVQSEPISSDRLDHQVLARLRSHPSVNADRIRVVVDGGAVRLEGTVSSLFERRAAEWSTAAIPGVTTIDSQLEVRQSPVVQRSDAALEADIERSLWWDPRVGAAAIDVTVEDGVVTLRGEVANREVYNAVLENALQAAPTRLVDELWQRRPARFVYPN